MADNTTNQLFNMLIAGVVIVALGVVLAVGSDITVSVREDVRELVTQTNDSQAIASNSVTLTYGYVNSLTQCANDTATLNLPAQCNISTDDPDNQPVVRVQVDAVSGETHTYNFTYSREALDRASLAAGNSTSAFANFSKWTPTVSTVVAAGVILALLLTGFVFVVMRRGTRI